MSVMSAKSSDWRPGPSVCRCCFAEGCYKDISTEYFWMGKREVYQEMLSDTFDVSISYSLSGGPNSNSRLICEPCISRLRDASDFKRQVQECERVFQQHLDPSSSGADLEGLADAKEVKLERVKLESKMSDDDDDFDGGGGFDDDDDDDLDDQPLTKLATKVPKKESIDLMDLLDNAKPEKRKAVAKPKASPAKKIKLTKKTDAPKPSVSKPAPKPAAKKKGVDTEKAKADLGKNLSKDLEELENRDAPKLRNSNETGKPCLVWTNKYKIATNLQKSGGGPKNGLGWSTKDQITATKLRNSAVQLILNTTIMPFTWRESLFKCFFCVEKFVKFEELKKHYASLHHSLTQGNVLKAVSKMKRSALVNIDVVDPKCKLCKEKIDDFQDLKLHLSEKHKIIEVDINNDGVLPFTIINEQYFCAICHEKFHEFMNLTRHMNIHYQNYVCDRCGAGFALESRLAIHVLSHQTGQFPCDVCGKVFHNSHGKQSHLSRVHLNAKVSKCQYCSQTFKYHPQKKKHMMTVHKLEVKEFPCDMCPKTFLLSCRLNTHKRMVHLKTKRHSCNICDWKCYTTAELTRHMLKHGGNAVKKYECTVCKKSYARKYTLTEHMRIHNNDRRFVCEYCNSAFVQKCSLQGHIKTHHRLI